MKFEPLEPRTLMSFTFVLSSGTLTITGSDSTVATDADQIQITQNGSAVTATDIRTGAAQTASSGVSKIVVDLRSGDDYVRLRNNDGTKPVILNSTIFGGLGNDTIYGGDVNDNLSGGDGDDKLQGRGGSDVYDGGAGFDTADYSYETRALSVSLDGLTNDGVIDVDTGLVGNQNELDTVQNTIEAVVGGSGNDTLIGNGSANLLDGGAGNDGIAGLLGNDTVTGGLGTDTILGNEGNDFLFAKDGIADAINAGTGTDSAQVDTTPKDVATAATTVSTPLAAVAMLRALGANAVYSSSLQGNNPAGVDINFGNNGDGTVVNGFGFSDLSIKKVVAQEIDLGDGFFETRLVVVGSVFIAGNSNIFVGRLTANGDVDTSFGSDAVTFSVGTQGAGAQGGARSGYILTELGIGGPYPTNDFANDVVIDAAGRIVVAGRRDNDLGGSDVALVRYTADGQLDLSFGGDTIGGSDQPGTVVNDIGVFDEFQSLVSSFEGGSIRYYAIGTSDGAAIVYKFDEVGQYDSGFAPIQIFQDGQQFAGVDLALDSQGNLWTLSKRIDGDFYGHALVIGYNQYGELLYGGSGSSAQDFDYAESGYSDYDPTAIAIGSVFGTDSIIVVGTASSGSAGTLAQSYISIGTFNDQTTWNIDFQSKQTVTDPLGESLSFVDVAFNGYSPDGKARIVVTGTESGNGPDQFYTGRFFNDLQGDITFNSNGDDYLNYVFTQVGDASDAAALVTPDAIYVAGTVYNSNETTSAGVVKYNGGNLVLPPPVIDAPPELDPTFGPDSNPAGTIKQLFGQTVTIEDVTTQRVFVPNIEDYEEKILLVGTIGQALQQNNGGAIDQFVARLNADGSLDNTFGWLLESGGRAGYYSVDFGSGFLSQRADYVNKVVVNPDNTITLLGTSYATDENNIQTDGQITIARLTQNGLLDLTFGASDGEGGRTGKNMVDLAADSSEKTVDVIVQPITVGLTQQYQYVVLSEGQYSGRAGGKTALWTYDGQTAFFGLSGFYDPSGQQTMIAAGADSGGNLWFLSQSYEDYTNNTHFTLQRTEAAGNPVGGAYFSDPFGPSVGNNYSLTDMVIGPDDKVYFTASVDDLPPGRAGVITAQISGTGMAQTGSAIFISPITSQGPDRAIFNEATLDSEGRLLIAGRINNGNDVMLFRTEAGGLTADVTYGDQGFAYYDNYGEFNSGPHIGGIAVQSDGFIIIGGDAINRQASGLDGLNAPFAARFDPTSLGVTDGVENVLPDNFDPSNLVIDDPENASNGQQLPGYLIVDLVPTVQAVPLTITGTSNDDSITITQIIGQNGEPLVQVQVNTDVTTYDPASISEYIIDGFGGTDSINFSPAAHLPLTINGEDGFTLRIGSSANELGQITPITSVTSPNGAAQLFDNSTPDAGDDYILYTPTNGSFGLDSFSYTVGAPQGAASQIALSADEITVSINVSNINDAPVADPETLSDSAEDATRTILASELLGNDAAGASNESGQTIVITSVSNAVGGTVELLANGNIKFTPTPDYNGPAGFDYTITDDGTTNGVPDPKSASATATFTVTEVNDAPTANNDTPTNIAEDSGDYVIPFSDLLGNDSKGPLNESGQTLTITGVSNAVGGTVKIVGSTVVFTPTADYNGAASFKYTVSDDGTTNAVPDFKTSLGTASFSVTPVNDQPTANAGGPYTVTSGQTISLNGSATDVDLPNDVLTYKWDLDGDGIFGETGASAVNGDETGATPSFKAPSVASQTSYSVSLKVTDSGNLSDTKSVNITINPLATDTKLTGTVIGTTGSYNNNGNTREKAFDGNPNTFFQPPQGSNLIAWVGLDFGAATPKTITQVKLLPKAGTAGSLVFGQVQASNDPTFKTGVTVLSTLLTVSSSGYTTINISNPNGFRAVRFVGTIGSNFNIAEMEVYGKTPVPDTVKPTKPGKPTASSIGLTSLKLNWAASTDAYGVKGYNIYRDGNLIGTSTDTSYTDTNLKPGTTYSYTVRAFDAVPNTSDPSDALSVKTVIDSTPPSKPGKPRATSITRTSLTLSWTASTDNVAVVKYFIYQNGVKIGESTTPSFNVINLTRNTTYTFTVAALDISNNMSVLSDPLAVKTSN